jgi:predicted transposase YdaD
MRESVTYQAILQEGRSEGLVEGRNEGLIEGRLSEARRMLLMLGETRLGAPDETTHGVIEAIRDVERLEGMSRRLLDAGVHDWNGLLSTP